jgi:hypothetical protein
MVQQYCDRQDSTVWLVTRRPTGDEAFDQVLDQLHPSADNRWWIAAASVQQKAQSASIPDADYALSKRLFYLNVEGLALTNGEIWGLPSLFMQSKKVLKFSA